ncbi:MAG: cupin domain-containing protein [Pseudonocardiaceae bacterium]
MTEQSFNMSCGKWVFSVSNYYSRAQQLIMMAKRHRRSSTVSSHAEGIQIARLLGLERLPGEGGLFRRTYIDAHCPVIYFMLIAPDFSALHTLDGVGTYHWYAGSPLQLLLLYPGGPVEQPVLGQTSRRKHGRSSSSRLGCGKAPVPSVRDGMKERGLRSP